MSHAGREGILAFIQDPKNKPLKNLIELAVNEDEEALNYIEYIQDEITKKFSAMGGGSGSSNNALFVSHLKISLKKEGQESFDAIKKGCYFNEFGKLICENTDETNDNNQNSDDNNDESKKNDHENDSGLTFEQYEAIGKELTFYMFDILTSVYKFKARVVGNQKILKKAKSNKNKNDKKDFKFKSILFSKGFEQSDSIVIMIPPNRAAVSYTSLAIDEGLSYGTMLPYIDAILGWNKKVKNKGKNKNKNKNKTNNKKENNKNAANNAGKLKRRWGIMILDPQGKDANNNKYSIIKIFDKWLSKRIPSLGLFGLGIGLGSKQSSGTAGSAMDSGGAHKRTGSDESIQSSLSVMTAMSGPRIKADIKNLYFIGCLQNGDLVSHLMHRRGKECSQVVKGCIFLGSDDPYDVNDITMNIYKEYGINYLNHSKMKINELVDGKKSNGDPYIIERRSSGNARYCVQSALPQVLEFIKESLIEKEEVSENDLKEQMAND